MNHDIKKQLEQYDGFAQKYAQHYNDPNSLEYRNRFIYDRLFFKYDLTNTLILDALCGSGGSASYLSDKGAQVIGLDISLKGLQIYQSLDENRKAVCGNAFSQCFPKRCFDQIIIIGGLHHLQPRINDALIEFHRILKKGGSIYLCEPHKGSLPDLFRRVWYKFDPLFLSNELSIDIKKMIVENSSRFSFDVIGYYGNLAYLFILNSMVLRINPASKKKFASGMFTIEKLLSRFNTRIFSCFVLIKGKAQ